MESISIIPKVIISMIMGLLLASCSLQSASMRVDVEVYKGPMSKEVPVQIGELVGVLKTTVIELKKLDEYFTKNASTIAHNFGYASASECGELKIISKEINESVANAESTIGKFSPCADYMCLNNNDLKIALRDISQLSTQLKIHALNHAYLLNYLQSMAGKERILTIGYINLASELSNQLNSRADALLKQIDGKEGNKLPQSVYLRDSAPTSFRNMYVWNREMTPSWSAEDGSEYPSMSGSKENARKVRELEHHFADHYWSTINTVVATGQGDVGMALIKDDIGNWNLKKFSNDPTEMLQAYKKVGLSALEMAASLVKASSGNIPLAQSFVAMADKVNSGGGSGSSLDGLVSTLHINATNQLQTIINEAVTQLKVLTDDEKKMLTIAENKADSPVATCTPENAKTLVPDLRSRSYKLLGQLPTESTDNYIKEARIEAEAALKLMENQPLPECDDITKVNSHLLRAEAWGKAYSKQEELTKLPAKTKALCLEVLDAHEHTLSELGHVSQISASKAPTLPVPSM